MITRKLWSTSLAAWTLCATAALAQPPCPAGTVLGGSVAAAAAGTLTIAPNGGIESFAGNGLIVEVCVTCDGVPLPGVPAAAITATAPGLFFCAGGNSADGATDALGCTFFIGPMEGGGCAPSLDVFVAGTYLGTVPVGINSPDTGAASPLFVDASDIATLASALGRADRYSICLDWNEDGFVDAADIAYFAGLLGAACP